MLSVMHHDDVAFEKHADRNSERSSHSSGNTSQFANSQKHEQDDRNLRCHASPRTKSAESASRVRTPRILPFRTDRLPYQTVGGVRRSVKYSQKDAHQKKQFRQIIEMMACQVLLKTP